MPKPNFLIVGFPRCGTTWLHEMLGEHPEIFMSDSKELHFFENRHGRYEKGLDWYLSHFEHAGEVDAIGEATPHYVYLEEALDRIDRDLDEPKVIVSVRHPVRRAFSRYWRHRTKMATHRSFESVLEEYPRIRKKREGRYPNYVEESLYFEQWLPWHESLPEDRKLVVFYERLADRPREVLDMIYSYLGVSDDVSDPVSLEQQVNPAKTHRSQKLVDVLTFVKNTLNKYGARWIVQVLKSLGLREVVLNWSLTESNDYKENLDDQTVERLYREYFREDARKFLELTKTPRNLWE